MTIGKQALSEAWIWYKLRLKAGVCRGFKLKCRDRRHSCLLRQLIDYSTIDSRWSFIHLPNWLLTCLQAR